MVFTHSDVAEYKLAQEARGATQRYSKTLTYPALINYKYVQNPELPALILKVTKSEDSSVALLDENNNKISPQEVSEEGNSIINRFYSPQFKKLNIEISESAVSPAGIAGYVILGILILLVLLYPVLRKKSEKLQSTEEKITPEEYAGFLVKTKEELENEKSEILSKLSNLDKDYTSGNLLDEEYEERRKSYEENVEKINRRIEQLG